MYQNNLEKTVEDILRKDGWQILANAYYTDPTTQKPREHDFVATTYQPSQNDAVKYVARLFIECKNFPEKTEVFSSDSNLDESANFLIAFNIPFAKIDEIEKNNNTHFRNYKEIFRSKDSKDYLHAAINQNLQSFSAFRKDNNENAVYYLVVVYNGDLSPNSKKILIKVDTLDDVFKLPNKRCFIELVHISEFENLIRDIRQDLLQINRSMIFYYQMAQNNQRLRRKQIEDNSCV